MRVRGGTLALLLAVMWRGTAAADVTSADQVCSPAADPCVVESAIAVATGSDLDFGPRALRIASGGSLAVDSGDVTIHCGSLRIDANGKLLGRGSLSRPGGSVTVDVGSAVSIAGQVDVSGTSAGTLSLAAAGQLTLDGGSIRADGLIRDSDGGSIDLSADEVTLNGIVSATGGNNGSGGMLTLLASRRVAITSSIDVSGGQGDAGEIEVTSGGGIEVAATATLRGNGSYGGFGQTLTMSAGDPGFGNGTGSLLLAGSVLASGGDTPDGGGDGGEIDLSAADDCQIGANITAESGSPYAVGGEISITCGSGASAQTTVSGQIDASGAGTECGGGGISIETPGSLTVSGTISATGASSDGGEVGLSGNGPVNVSGSVILDASAYGEAGSLSLYSFDASVAIGGTISAHAGFSPAEGGGGGGYLDIEAGSDCQIDGTINAKSGWPDGQGGALTIECGQDDQGSQIEIGGTINVSGAGDRSGNGYVSINSGGAVSVSGKILATSVGTDAGNITIRSNGDVSLPASALVSADGTYVGAGGSILIDAGGQLDSAATLSAKGGGGVAQAAPGGAIELRGEACSIGGTVALNGGRPNANGGRLDARCVAMSWGAAADVSGPGGSSRGGSIDLSSQNGDLTVTQDLDASGGSKGGGTVSAAAAHDLGVAADISVKSIGGPAGTVNLSSADGKAMLTAGGSIDASPNTNQKPGGHIIIRGCLVDIQAAGRAWARGVAGRIDLTGINRTSVAGEVDTDPSTGTVRLIYRDFQPTVTGAIVPVPQTVVDPTLPGCAAGQPTPTATASAAPTPIPSATLTPSRSATPPPTPTATVTPTRTPTATMTPTPRPTPAGPGDANCDGRIDTADLLALSRAIFDRVLENECPVGDANQDGKIDAADYPNLVRRLLGDLPF